MDTRDGHADAEENDEKRESFEDLPEHLRLGTEFTLRVTVLQVQPSLTTYFESDTAMQWSCLTVLPLYMPFFVISLEYPNNT